MSPRCHPRLAQAGRSKFRSSPTPRKHLRPARPGPERSGRSARPPSHQGRRLGSRPSRRRWSYPSKAGLPRLPPGTHPQLRPGAPRHRSVPRVGGCRPPPRTRSAAEPSWGRCIPPRKRTHRAPPTPDATQCAHPSPRPGCPAPSPPAAPSRHPVARSHGVGATDDGSGADAAAVVGNVVSKPRPRVNDATAATTPRRCLRPDMNNGDDQRVIALPPLHRVTD